MAEELKPCPFCGETPEMTKHFKEEMHTLIHRCRVIGPISLPFGNADAHIKAWNTRANVGAKGDV